MIAGAFYELLPEDIAEQEVVIRLMLTVFQVFRQDTHHRMIERHDQRLSILSHVHIHYVVIKVKILDLNVHQASLSDACDEQEVGDHPALVFGEVAFLDVGLLQQQFQFVFVIGFDRALIHLDRLHFKMRDPTLVHKEMQGRNQIS